MTSALNRPGAQLRASDPAFYEMRHAWNADSLLVKTTLPRGNTREWFWEVDLRVAGSTPPGKKGRLLLARRFLRPPATLPITPAGQVFVKFFLRRNGCSPKRPAPFRALAFDALSRLTAKPAGESSSRRPSGVAGKGFAVCVWDSFHRNLGKNICRLRKIRLRHNRIPLMSASPPPNGFAPGRQRRVFRLWFRR